MKNLTLGGKLHLMVLIILIPLFILQITGIIHHKEQMLDSELVAEQEYAEAMRGTFVNYLNYLWDFGFSVGTTIINTDYADSPEKTQGFLEELITATPAYEDFFWVGPEGAIFASTLAKTDRPVTDLDVIQQIVAGADRGISDLIIPQGSSRPIIFVAQGIRHDGRLLGIFMASLRVEALGQILPQGRSSRFKYSGLIDRQGTLIFDKMAPQQDAWRPIILEADSPIRTALAGQVVQVDRYYSPRDQQTYMAAALPIPEVKWAVFASTSRTEVLVQIKDRINDYLSWFLGVMTISLIFALLIGVHLMRPIHALRNTALQIAQGNFAARTQIKGENELGITGQSFDRMAGRIQVLEDSRLQFLQTAAHELRNPMAGIKSILSLLQRVAGQTGNLVQSQQMLKLMEKEINRLSRLLNQILEAFRTQREAQYLAFQWSRTDLIKVITGAIQSFQINEKDARICFEPPNVESAWIYGDFHRLEEVVRSLIHNAIKFSPAGSEVLLRLKAEEQDWLVAVQDQGIGIPKGQLEHIFDCFRRADNLSEETDPGGLGLGLYICKLIIQRHNGSIWVTSEEGYGSIFYIRIPRYKN